MALQLTELDAYVNKHIAPRTTDIIYASDPLFTRLSQQNAERFTGNTRVLRPVIVGELNGDFMGRGEEMDISFVTTDAAITCDMKVAWVNISLYGWDAMNNDGEEAVFNQVEMKFLNASLKMAKLLATNMYLNGQGARSRYLNGLQEWYDDGNTYATVGGQTRADITAVGTVGGLNAYAATLTSVTLPQINTAYGNACWGSDHPDLLVCSQSGYSLIWNATQPSQRYANNDNDLANVGFLNFKFNAADVVVSRYIPTGASGLMLGINSQYVEWYFSEVPLFQYGWTGFKGVNKTIDVAGQYLVGSNIMVPSPRTGFKLTSALF